MKKVTLKNLNAYCLSVEEKKSIKGGYGEVTYPVDMDEPCPMTSDLTYVKYAEWGCSYSGFTTICLPCTDPRVRERPACSLHLPTKP